MKKVLLIEDSITVRQQVGFAIRQTGAQVMNAENGQIGLDLLARHVDDIGLIFLDLHMPVLSGMEALETIKYKREFSQIPVFILTTEGCQEMLDKARSLGAVGWITKPFLPETIWEAIKRYLKSE